MIFCKYCKQKPKNINKLCENCRSNQCTEDSYNEKTLEEDFNSKTDSIDLKSITKMIIRPVQGAKTFIEGNSVNSLFVLTMFILFVQGLLGVWKVNSLFLNIKKLTTGFETIIMNFISFIEPNSYYKRSFSDMQIIANRMDKFKTLLSISYGKIFFESIILLAIIILILFIVLILLVNIISKNKKDTFKLYKISLISVIPYMYFEIFAIIFCSIKFYISIIIILCGIVVSLVSFTILIKDELQLKDDMCVFIVFISTSIILICMYIFIKNFMVADTYNIFRTLLKNI